MSRINKRGRYSRYEDAVIERSVRQYGTDKGFDLSAKQLSRSRDGIMDRYYKHLAKSTVKETPKVKVEEPVSQPTLFSQPEKVDVAVPREVKSVQLTIAGVELHLTFK